MTDIRQITDWRSSTRSMALYQKLLGCIGTGRFGAAVRESALAVTGGARRVYVFEAASRDDTSLHYYHCEPGLVPMLPTYRKWYLPQDPVCDAYDAAPRFGDVALQRVSPRDIRSPSFRRRIFDDAGINLTRIESRPSRQKHWDYVFLVDLEGHRSDPRVADAIERLRARCEMVKVLGSYPRSTGAR